VTKINVVSSTTIVPLGETKGVYLVDYNADNHSQTTKLVK